MIRISGDPLLPVGYIQPHLTNTWMSAHAVITEITEGHYFLSSGSILANAKTPLLIDTPHGSVMVKQDSVAIISSQETMTRIFDLHDHHRNGVTAISGENSLNLNPGSEAALMDRNERDVNRVVLTDDIGHRNVRMVTIGGGRGMVTGDFSMGDLLAYHPLLQQLRKSPDKADQELVQSLLKTAAAMSSMNLGR